MTAYREVDLVSSVSDEEQSAMQDVSDLNQRPGDAVSSSCLRRFMAFAELHLCCLVSNVYVEPKLARATHILTRWSSPALANMAGLVGCHATALTACPACASS